MKKILALCMALALVAGTASAALVWSEGFNSDYSPSWSGSFGVQFGPNIINDTWNTEGDGGAWANTDQTGTSGAGLIIGGQDFVIGIVAAAGETCTFTGDFGWKFGTSASDVAIHGSQTGFMVDGGAASLGNAEYVFGAGAELQMFEYTFSYTTIADDIGKTIEGRVRTVDKNNITGLTQLLTDNWQVDVVPEPATLGLVGLVGAGLLMARRLQI